MSVSLKEIVWFEGGGQSLRELAGRPGITNLRALRVLMVWVFYRPARKKLDAADKMTQETGRAQMMQFVRASEALYEQAIEAGDVALSLLALHSAATGAGLAGDLGYQCTTNRRVMESIEVGGGDWQRDPDLTFVHSRCYFGLLENDEGFRASVPLIEWTAAVTRSEVDRDPDFPGRALFLAKHLIKIGQIGPQVDELLERALGSVGYGKPDQISDVKVYIASRGSAQSGS